MALAWDPCKVDVLLYREKMEGGGAWSFQKCYFPYLRHKTSAVLCDERRQGSRQCLSWTGHLGFSRLLPDQGGEPAGSQKLLGSPAPCDPFGQRCLRTGERLAQGDICKLASGQTLFSCPPVLTAMTHHAIYIFIYIFGIEDPSSH